MCLLFDEGNERAYGTNRTNPKFHCVKVDVMVNLWSKFRSCPRTGLIFASDLKIRVFD